MPRWIGDESSSDPNVVKLAQAATDLALLVQTTQAAAASLGEVRAAPLPWMSADVRVRAHGVQQLCEVLATQAEYLAGLLQARGDRPEP